LGCREGRHASARAKAGGFDLIFGAAKQNLRIIEAPIHDKARIFGKTQISRFRDGWLLLKMAWFSCRKLKAI
jgi:hypothetical protein